MSPACSPPFRRLRVLAGAGTIRQAPPQRHLQRVEISRATRSRRWTSTMPSTSGAGSKRPARATATSHDPPQHEQGLGPLLQPPHLGWRHLRAEDDWRLRMRREPLAEMYQVKGASECALGVGATDEECAFSQVLKPCEPGQETGCALRDVLRAAGAQDRAAARPRTRLQPVRLRLGRRDGCAQQQPGRRRGVGLRRKARCRQHRRRSAASLQHRGPASLPGGSDLPHLGRTRRRLGGGEHARRDLRRHEAPRGLCDLGAAHRPALLRGLGLRRCDHRRSQSRSRSPPRAAFRWEACCGRRTSRLGVRPSSSGRAPTG